MNKNRLNNWILLSLLFLPVSTVLAETESFKNRISIGGFILSRYESELGLTDANSGVGATVDTRKALGMENEQTVFRLDGHYRLNDNHSLIYSWYRIKSTGTRSGALDIPWDPPINETGTITSTLKTELYKLGYLWSFHHDEKVELGIGIGLHVTRIGVELKGETSSGSYQGESVNTTLPLPVAILKLGYNITPKMKVTYLSQIFALEFEGIDGTYSDQTLGLEYRFWKNIALGLALNGTSTSVEQEKDGRILSFNNRITGLLLSVSGYF